MAEKNMQPEAVLPELEVLNGAGDHNEEAASDSVAPLARVTELAYQGAPEGSGVFCPVKGGVGPVSESSSESLRLAVLLRPQVPMRQLVAVGPVAAMAVLSALEEQGARPDAIGIAWPHDVVLIADETKLPGSFVSLATLTTKAGYADGMFVALGIDVNANALANALSAAPSAATEQTGQVPASPVSGTQAVQPTSTTVPLSPEGQRKFAHTLQAYLVAAMREWEKNAATPNAQAGPWAPFLQDYFDRVPLLGQAVNVCYPNGRVYARGIFVGIDIWGRATVRTRRAGDIEFPAEKFRIEPQSY